MEDQGQGFGGGGENEVEMREGKARKAGWSQNMRSRAVKPRLAEPSPVKTSNMFENLSEDASEDSEQDPCNPLGARKTPKWVRVNQDTGIMSVDFNKQQEIGSVVHVNGEWERIPVKIDSGAVDTVVPRSMVEHIPIQDTAKSSTGRGFRAANGSHIKHYGQK